MIYEPKNRVNNQNEGQPACPAGEAGEVNAPGEAGLESGGQDIKPPSLNSFTGILIAVISLILVLAAVLMLLVLSNKGLAPTENAAEAGPGGAAEHFPRDFFELRQIDGPLVIVIDPGHGGKDPGAVQQGTGLSEAEVNRRVCALLIEKLGEKPEAFKLVVTDPDGEGISTAQRSTLARQAGGDLFISLHLNSDKYPESRGFQVFPPPPGWVYHEESLRFAALLCEGVGKTQLPLMGEDGIYYAFYEPKANGGYSKEMYSAHWYAYQTAKKTETFGVIERSGCPAVLIEQWFISSSEDMKLMYNYKGMELMAEIIYNSICSYFGVAE